MPASGLEDRISMRWKVEQAHVGPGCVVIEQAQSISWLDGVKGDLNQG